MHNKSAFRPKFCGAYCVPANHQGVSGRLTYRQGKTDEPAVQRIKIKRFRAQKISLCLACGIVLDVPCQKSSDTQNGKRLTGVNEARYKEEYKSSVTFGGV